MPLLAFWQSNPDAVAQLHIEQIVSNAGEGVLKDGSACSAELREYLGQISTPKIARYIDHCLNISFPKSGMVLQDLVNELGRRLDYAVTNGRYQGAANTIGFDGLWRSQEEHTLVVEVKTTDAYRLSLDTLANYRSKLIAAGEINGSSSVLIVVGREDTGELEAQIRGSRHAWDVRVISAEALIKLVLLKENSEAVETGLKIRSLLTPVEYTRLDRMIDVMFTTATDVEGAPVEQSVAAIPDAAPASITEDAVSVVKPAYDFTDSKLLQVKREQIIAALAQLEKVALVRKSRALYWSPHHDVRAACSISKRYTGKNQHPYWYAYHPAWDNFLIDSTKAFFVLGCMDKSDAFAIPRAVIAELLPYLHTTSKDGNTYWHIHLLEQSNNLELLIPKKNDTLALSPFTFATAERCDHLGMRCRTGLRHVNTDS